MIPSGDPALNRFNPNTFPNVLTQLILQAIIIFPTKRKDFC
jgi:hypothetical protein